MSAATLKSLQTRAASISAEITANEEASKALSQKLVHLRSQLTATRTEIANLTKTEPVVTEHAMLRYIERVMGVDLQSITDAILTEQNRKAIAFAGNCRIKSQGVEFIVKDRKVISVVDKAS